MEEKYTEADKQLFRDTIHETVHQVLINQPLVLRNIVRNVTRTGIIGAFTQEQTVGPVYFGTSAPVVGKIPIEEHEMRDNSKIGQQSVAPIPISHPIGSSAPHNSPMNHHIARDYGENFFRNY